MKIQKSILGILLLALGLPLLAEDAGSMPSLQKIESIYQEENEPVIFIISATGIDTQTVWQLVGTTMDGKSVAASPVTVSALTGSTWELVFPGQAQGDYYIHATDTNGNQSVLSDALSVTEHSPVLVSVFPQTEDSRKSFSLELIGKYIQPDSKVELIADADGKPVTGIWQKQKDPSKLLVNFSGMAPGVYSLQVTSAKQKIARLPSAIKVFNPAPDLSGFDEQKTLRVAKVSGSNWTPEMKAYLSKGDDRHEAILFGQTDGNFSLVYEDELQSGKYDLVLVNNEGKESTLKNVLEVRDDASLPHLWVGAGVDLAFIDGAVSYQPSFTVNYSLIHKRGFCLGYEGGLSYLLAQPKQDNEFSFWADQWFGYTFKQPDDVNYMSFRLPVGIRYFSNSSFPYVGLFFDYEVSRKWIAEAGYEYPIFSTDIPYSSAIHFAVIRQF